MKVDSSTTQWSVLFGMGALIIALSPGLVALAGGTKALMDGDGNSLAMVIGFFALGAVFIVGTWLRLGTHDRSVETYKRMTYWLTLREKECGAPAEPSAELEPDG